MVLLQLMKSLLLQKPQTSKVFLQSRCQNAEVTSSESYPSIIRAGTSFTVEVNGVAFDTINDKIMLFPGSSECGADIPPPWGKYPSAASYSTLSCRGPGRAPTKLVCPGVSVYQTGNFIICVCDASRPDLPKPSNISQLLNTSTTTTLAFYGCMNSSRYFVGSSSRGVVTISGPNYAGTLNWRAGAEAQLVISGSEFVATDRIRIVNGTTNCADSTMSKAMHPSVLGTFPWTSADSGNPTLYGQTAAKWSGITITDSGTYQVCWCPGGPDNCNSDQGYVVPIATALVGGPSKLPQQQACIAGVLSTIAFSGTGLNDNDRIIVIEDRFECGKASQSSGVVQGGGGSWTRTSGDGTLSCFGGVILGRQGNFKVCWCGGYDSVKNPNGCANGLQYNIYIGNMTVGGPTQGRIDRVPVGKPFTYIIRGWGLSDTDRISIVDSSVACASAKANEMSLGVELNSMPAGPPAGVLGDDPLNRTSVAWSRIIVTQMVQYRVCWCARFTEGDRKSVV